MSDQEHTAEIDAPRERLRILITGSRDWTDAKVIHEAMWRAWTDAECPPNDTVTVVHGGARGADAMAANAAVRLGMRVECHPADWQRHGKRAGFVRNADMVNLGADVCLAFIKDGSRGATMTADLAERAGIPTTRVIPPGVTR